MSEKSITSNAILNILRNGINIIFPLLSFPYISRVLGPESIGEVNYVLSITAYFTLLSTFGIPIYGTRELSKVKDDKQKLERVANELFIISLISTIITYILYVTLIFTIPQFGEFKLFFLIAGFLILFNTIGLEWLFQAMEDYLLITLRSIMVKVISLILLFLLVHSGNDNIFYLSITVFATVGANIFNLIYSSKYIKLNIFRGDLHIARHLKPLVILLLSSLVGSIYLGMDVFILGTLTKDYNSVGLYYAAIKINRILITVLASVSSVIVPRMSYYIETGEQVKYRQMLQRVFDINILFAFPIVIYLIIYAKEIMYLISGPSYEQAIITMQLITPMILIAAITNILYNQILIPYNKEKVILWASLVGGVACIVLNLVLVPIWLHNGTAIATVITEALVMIVELIAVYSIVKKHLFSKSQLNILLASFVLTIILLLLKLTLENMFIIILSSVLIGGPVYLGMLYLLKDYNVDYLINKFFKKRLNT